MKPALATGQTDSAIHSRLNWIALPGGIFSLQTVSEKRREPDIRIAEAV
jgi:hypothetical protein